MVRPATIAIDSSESLQDKRLRKSTRTITHRRNFQESTIVQCMAGNDHHFQKVKLNQINKDTLEMDTTVLFKN